MLRKSKSGGFSAKGRIFVQTARDNDKKSKSGGFSARWKDIRSNSKRQLCLEIR